jgi:hypothetical protein
MRRAWRCERRCKRWPRALWWSSVLCVWASAVAACDAGTTTTRLGPPHVKKRASQARAETLVDGGGRDAAADSGATPGAAHVRGGKFLGQLPEDETLRLLLGTKIKHLLPIGSTSVAFRVTFQQESVGAAYKPKTYESPRGYASEVAAYRIGRALGFDNIPPATVRTLSKVVVKASLDDKYQTQWDDFRRAIFWDGDGLVEGAAIFWVAGMKSMDLDRKQSIREWMRWLKHDGELPVDKTVLARDLSRMLCFDYLIANTDRFSGDNVQVDASASRVIVRDHNLAFASPLYERLHERILNLLLRVERYSRSFVDQLRALDAQALGEALGSEGLLTDAQIGDVLDRRQAMLSRVAALVGLYGEDKVLYFE